MFPDFATNSGDAKGLGIIRWYKNASYAGKFLLIAIVLLVIISVIGGAVFILSSGLL